jgi:histidinol-phosphate aminotransferase
VFLVNPHNPSGTVTENNALRSFVSDVARTALVIVDEAYLEFTDDFAQRSLVDRVRVGENVMVFRTFSKIYGLAALQLGYAIAPTPLASALLKQGLGAAHTLNRLGVLAASAALRDTDFLDASRRKIAHERLRWHAALDSLKLRHSDSLGNCVFLIGLPARDSCLCVPRGGHRYRPRLSASRSMGPCVDRLARRK